MTAVSMFAVEATYHHRLPCQASLALVHPPPAHPVLIHEMAAKGGEWAHPSPRQATNSLAASAKVWVTTDQTPAVAPRVTRADTSALGVVAIAPRGRTVGIAAIKRIFLAPIRVRR
jgi:hypothetical protein